jgi:hypothetical protein
LISDVTPVLTVVEFDQRHHHARTLVWPHVKLPIQPVDIQIAGKFQIADPLHAEANSGDGGFLFGKLVTIASRRRRKINCATVENLKNLARFRINHTHDAFNRAGEGRVQHIGY